MSHRSHPWLVSGLLLALGCGGDGADGGFGETDDPSTGSYDSGAQDDGDPVQVSPTPGKDAASDPGSDADADAEVPSPDAGADAGEPGPLDAGGGESDAGAPDAGRGEPDAGPPVEQHKVRLSLAGAGSGRVLGRLADSAEALTCTRAEGSCAATVDEGTEVVLTAEPARDSTFTWGGACADVTTADCRLTVSAAQDVSITFDLKVFTLSIAVEGTGNPPGRGRVVSEPAGITCATTGAQVTCSAPFEARTRVRLRATPIAPGNSNQVTFSGWGGACEDRGQNLLCELELGDDTQVSAGFKRN